MTVKQIIVMRDDLNMRKGKMTAQGAHASMAVLLNQGSFIEAAADSRFVLEFDTNSPLHQWLTGAFTKICVRVSSEEQLVEVYEAARDRGLPCALITDSGKTEFNGVPTKTCCAIGPALAEDLQPITGELKLL